MNVIHFIGNTGKEMIKDAHNDAKDACEAAAAVTSPETDGWTTFGATIYTAGKALMVFEKGVKGELMVGAARLFGDSKK